MTTGDRDADDDSVCFYCGWPECRCDDLDEDDYDTCEHGVPFDQDCEDCDAEDYEEHMARFGPLPY